MKKLLLSTLILVAGFGAFSQYSFAKAPTKEYPKVNLSAEMIKSAADVPQADWKSILPPPPENSTEIANVIAAQGTKSGALWEQSHIDNSLDAFKLYQPVLGSDFTLQNHPEVETLITYAGQVTWHLSASAKNVFPRVRPVNYDPKNVSFCGEGDFKFPTDSSYPSGHTAWGWTSAQILARLYPTKADAILTRGREYGEHRVVCGAHFPSDVTGGRIAADVIMQRLDNDATYISLFAKAKAAENK